MLSRFQGVIVVFRNGQIAGVVISELPKHSDRRGWLSELFRSDELPQDFVPVMGYVSSTEPGVARGPHEHREQTDKFCFVGPSTFRVYLWDNRKDSPTFGNKIVLEAGAEQPKAMIIPPGVIHAYKNIGPIPGWIFNLSNRLYAGEGRKEKVDEIRHENDTNTIFKLD
jgi:dTDP-4-dehydrorhamnose 3,5-epimerase